MAGPSVLGAIEYMAETAFAETSTTFSTFRVPVLGMVNTSGLVHTKEERGSVEQYMHGGNTPVLMGQGGSFEMEIDVAGHESTTAGSPSLTATETLLGLIFGNVALSASASTTYTGGTATAPTTTASATFSAGGIVFSGVLGDARGNGQAHVVSTHATTTLNLLTGMDALPTNGDVLYPAACVYPSETPSVGLNGTVVGLRFRLLTNNLQYSCHGCAITGASFSGTNTGGRLKLKATVTVARWAAVSATFPSAVSTSTPNPGVVAAGSFFLNAVGTATRATKAIRDFTLNYEMNVAPLMGPGGVGAYQTIVGYRRLPTKISISWVEDADASPTATPVAQGYGTATTNYHALYTLNTTAGARVAMYFPKLCVTNVPVQFDDGGINRMKVECAAYTGGTTTNDLTLSAFRMGLA